MKELEFRSWHIKEQKMCFVDLLRPDNGAYLLGVIPDKSYIEEGSRMWVYPPEDGRYCINDEFYLMQFTGIRDKNNKKIFEGDLLLVPDEETDHILDDGSGPTTKFNHIAEVVFQDGSFGILINDSGNFYKKGFWSTQHILNWIGDNFSEFEIVGNIYENPELK